MRSACLPRTGADLVIDDPSSITGAWLSAVTGRHWQAPQVVEIGSGRALLSRVVRVGDGHGAPVIVKLPTTDPVQLLTACALGAYAREVAYYGVAPRGWPRSPRCAYAADDGSGTRVTIVLEDLGVDAFDQVQGLTVDELTSVADTVADLHASDADPALASATRRLDDPRNLELLALAVPNGIDAAAALDCDSVTGALGRFLDGFVGHAPRLLAMLSASGAPLHGDLRADNLLRHDGRVACLDFQMLASGSPFFDLAYLASQSADLTLAEHARVLEHHRRSLVQRGRRIEPSLALREYQASLLVCLAYPVVLAASADAMPERARHVVTLMLRRVASAIGRCGALEVLDCS